MDSKNIQSELINTANKNINMRFHFGNHETLSPKWNLDNAVCSNTKLYYILDGEIEVVIDDISYIAKKDDMMLIPASTVHSYHLTNKQYAEQMWIHFDLSIDDKNFFDIYNIPYKITVLEKKDEIKKMFDQLVENHLNINYYEILQKTALLSQLLHFYLKQASLYPRKENDSIWYIVEYIDQHFLDELNLDDLAQKTHLSKNQFIRRFKKLTGLTPMHYVMTLRMNKAKNLLDHTNYSISEIIDILHFYDFAYFSKMFKAYFNCTPTECRKK